jgi:hypothetical protein
MSISIRAELDGRAFEGILYSTVTAAQLLRLLPLEVAIERRGELYCAELHTPLGAWLEPDARTRLEPGEIAWWPARNTLCISLGGSSPSPSNPVGRLTGDFNAPATSSATSRLLLEAANTHTQLRP